MPTPTAYDLHTQTPLGNFTLAAMDQAANDFFAPLGGFVEVEKQTDKYYTYPVGGAHRLEMKRRGPNEESAGSGWSLSSDTYFCEKRSVHKDNSMDDLAEADDPIDLDADASQWLANQVMLEMDRHAAANVFAAATWTTDYDGAAATAHSSSEIKYWSSSGSTPQNDIMVIKTKVRQACLRRPNTMIVGEDVHNVLATHSELRSAAQYTNLTTEQFMADWQLLANFFGVERYVVAGGVYNSAKEGQTASMTTLVDADDVWVGYLDPNPGIKSMTAWSNFVWKKGGKASRGVEAKTFEIEKLDCVRHEVNLYHDVKIISADAGAFIDEAVA